MTIGWFVPVAMTEGQGAVGGRRMDRVQQPYFCSKAIDGMNYAQKKYFHKNIYGDNLTPNLCVPPFIGNSSRAAWSEISILSFAFCVQEPRI
jgi:hypothetical protein